MELALCSYVVIGLFALSFLRMALSFETWPEAFNHVFEKGSIIQLAFWPAFSIVFLCLKACKR